MLLSYILNSLIKDSFFMCCAATKRFRKTFIRTASQRKAPLLLFFWIAFLIGNQRGALCMGWMKFVIWIWIGLWLFVYTLHGIGLLNGIYQKRSKLALVGVFHLFEIMSSFLLPSSHHAISFPSIHYSSLFTMFTQNFKWVVHLAVGHRSHPASWVRLVSLVYSDAWAHDWLLAWAFMGGYVWVYQANGQSLNARWLRWSMAVVCEGSRGYFFLKCEGKKKMWRKSQSFQIRTVIWTFFRVKYHPFLFWYF